MPAMTLSGSTVADWAEGSTNAPLQGVSDLTAQRLNNVLQQLRSERDALAQRLFADESYRALMQLKAREAEGRPVEAMTSLALREFLRTRINAPGDVDILERLDEVISLLSFEKPLHQAASAGAVERPPSNASNPQPPTDASAVAAAASPVPVAVPTEPALGDVPIADHDSDSSSAVSSPAPIRATVSPAAAVAEVFSSATHRRKSNLPAPNSGQLRQAADDGHNGELVATEAAVFASVARLRGDPAPIPVPMAGGRKDQPAVMPTAPIEGKAATGSAIIVASDLAAGGASAAIDPLAIDRLERIRGIDSGLAARLRVLGVTRFAQIAQWQAEDIARIEHDLGQSVGIQRHNWIEQATLLAAGRSTRYARGVDAGIENPGRLLTFEPPPRRFGEPDFFRTGLVGGVTQRSRREPAPPRRDRAQHRETMPALLLRSRLAAGPADPALPESGNVSGRLDRSPLPALNGHAAARSAMEPEVRLAGDDDWAEVTIIPRSSAPSPHPSASVRTYTEKGPMPVLRNSEAVMAPPVSELRLPELRLPDRPSKTASMEEEAMVEIRRENAPVHEPELDEPGPDNNPLHRLLRALTDRQGH